MPVDLFPPSIIPSVGVRTDRQTKFVLLLFVAIFFKSSSELCGVTFAYIDFTTVGIDMKGRMQYTNSTAQFDWYINSTLATSKMILNASGLSVGGTFVSASDKRLKFNEKLLTNALMVPENIKQVHFSWANVIKLFTLVIYK